MKHAGLMTRVAREKNSRSIQVSLLNSFTASEAGNWRCINSERRRCDTACAGPPALECILHASLALTGVAICCRAFGPGLRARALQYLRNDKFQG